MKFILPFIISLLIIGCTTPNQQENKNSPMPTENTVDSEDQDVIFSTLHEKEKKSEHVYSNLNDTILDIANQLFDTKLTKKDPTRIILTSFVDLENFDKTSTFGKLLSESMYNELHIRKFQVTDFRGQDAVLVNEDGEFHITRDTEKLKEDIIDVEYILIGTYVKFENQGLLINARIMDSESGRLLSTARVVYYPRDCSLYGICKKANTKYNLYDGTADTSNVNLKRQIMDMNTREDSTFSIIQDDCKDVECKK